MVPARDSDSCIFHVELTIDLYFQDCARVLINGTVREINNTLH